MLDENGWVDVAVLLAALGGHGVVMSRDDLVRFVTENDKQRFELDVTAGRIRTRQGHSVSVELALEPSTPPDALFHGTPVTSLGSRRGRAVVLGVDAARMAGEGTCSGAPTTVCGSPMPMRRRTCGCWTVTTRRRDRGVRGISRHRDESRARASIRAKPRRFRPCQRVGTSMPSKSAGSPTPQTVSLGEASTNTRFRVARR